MHARASTDVPDLLPLCIGIASTSSSCRCRSTESSARIPDFDKLLQEDYPDLTESEKEFLDGLVQELCDLIDD